jgi:hypothetical protein
MIWFWPALAWLLIFLLLTPKRLSPSRKAPPPPPPAVKPPPMRFREAPKQAGLVLLVAHNGMAVDPYQFWRDKYAKTGDPADLEQMLRFVRRNP